jgi:hypothetical protein
VRLAVVRDERDRQHRQQCQCLDLFPERSQR